MNEELMVIGDESRMFRSMCPEEIGSITGVDLKRVGHERLLRKQARSLLVRSDVPLLKQVMLCLPPDVYQEAAAISGKRCALNKVMGINGSGHRNTLLYFLASIHQHPAELTDGFSGPVLGIHQLYGPSVTEPNQRTAVITSTSLKRSHHLHEHALKHCKQLLRKTNHQHILVLDVDAHDKAMAEVQFLTHSFFLIATEVILARGSEYSVLEKDLLGLAGRILAADSSIYEGIMQNNRFNREVWRELERSVLFSVANESELLPMWMCQLQNVVNHLQASNCVERKQQRFLSTPMSRARDNLFTAYSQHFEQGPGCDLKAQFSHYRRICMGRGYAHWFKSLAERLALVSPEDPVKLLRKWA